jgi:hypothetical protein
MEEPLTAAGYHPLWVLIYTSAVMMVLRFFAGPIVHALTPLGLLAACATLAIVGLFLLSKAAGLFAIFAAATLYGVAKTFFWPTTLGVVSEQTPKGGALTLNAIAGIGMLSVGIIGGPFIGALQEQSAQKAIERDVPGVYATISTEGQYFLGSYNAVDEGKVGMLPADKAAEVREVAKKGKQNALASVTILPAFMLVCYLLMIGYFKSRGGYKPVTLGSGGH